MAIVSFPDQGMEAIISSKGRVTEILPYFTNEVSDRHLVGMLNLIPASYNSTSFWCIP
jgi:apolipoprotein N-acyltransferase